MPITIQFRNVFVPVCFPKIHTTIILLAVINGYAIWSLTLREKCKLRKIFGPKRFKVTRGWRELHRKELLECAPHQILYYPGDQINNKLDRACGTYGFGGET
jgi:hypothetical protein